jgi:hypothetical protein
MKTAPQRYLLDGRGKKEAVVIPLSHYRRSVQDLHDLAVVAEHRNETRFSRDGMQRRFKSCGLQ